MKSSLVNLTEPVTEPLIEILLSNFKTNYSMSEYFDIPSWASLILAIAISFILFLSAKKSSDKQLYMTLERTIKAISIALQDQGEVSIDKDFKITFKPVTEIYEETFSAPPYTKPLSQIKIKPRWKNNNFISDKEYTLKFRIDNKKYKKEKATLFLKYNGILQQGKIFKIWRYWRTNISIKFKPTNQGNQDLKILVWESIDELVPLCPPLVIKINVISTN